MAAGYELKRRGEGHFYCSYDDCGQWAVWKGVVAGWFNAGRSCEEHKPVLEHVAKEMARGWRPCPCGACGR